MNKEEKLLLQLIKKSQFYSQETVDFSDVDMDALYKEALDQSVLGLIAPVIPSKYVDRKWTDAVYKHKSSYILYYNAQDDLKRLFNDANIPFVIIKGGASAINYTDPSIRTMGDIDFLVPQNLFDRSKSVMKNAGYIWDHDTDRHVAYKKDKQSFELHNKFSRNETIERFITEGIYACDNVAIEGFVFPVLPKIANGLVILDHMRGHVNSAIGLRHIIDWMMYVYKNIDDDFWNNEFKAVTEECGLTTLAITATRMCQLYLGLPENVSWCKNADISTCELFMEIVLSSGNFGCKNKAGKNIETVSVSIKKRGLFHWLQYAGEINWYAYQKCHCLKPFCWIYQICRYIKYGIKSGRNKKQIREDLERGKARYQLLNRLDIL